MFKKAIVKSLTWNISQSGCMNSPRKTVLYATDAMCIVCDAGSLGQKSSEALTTAVLFELKPQKESKRDLSINSPVLILHHISNMPKNSDTD